ncbi:tyrosinase-like protein 2 [Ectocarpus siliculosus]|uniref:Tyrosinase-like protein 2 n=1 Tax=Ectocarpus siliculosus TaxID=2880 RepID=D7FNR4_ECTSI|nr:tyrosinase-like protein 2 [Ectocarpus siliculosus]|eukprot:CBJ26075.1 tyrosinase-like protein 2 [Ectocarpus siliculosus]
MSQNKRRRAEETDSLTRDTEAMGEQRLGSWPSLRGSFSASSTPVEQSGMDGGAMAAGEQQQANLAAEVDSSGETTTTELQVRMFNTYTLQNPITLYPWEHMAEPLKPSTMELLDWPVSGEHLEYRWDADGHLQGYGRSVDVLFSAVGSYECSVVVFDPTLTGKDPTLRGGTTGNEESARVAGPYSFTVEVKYVRREIRSLSDQDREMFFNAMAVMQRVPSGVGQIVYGSNYYSKDYLTRLHLYYGGTKDCDHWHQGAGFVTSHMALTLMFEQSLQAINPAVTVPYWDFTLESTFFGSSDFRSSGVFADDWFGAASPDNDLHTPTKGRFGYVPAMADAKEFSKVYNSYGVLRSPWNNDPSPFMTRSSMIYGFFNNLKPSGCFEYSHALRHQDWMSFSMVLNAAAHGHIHETVGGSWNHYFGDEAKELDEEQDDSVMTFAHEIQALSKELWRSGFLDCPDTCSMDTPWEDCQCQCDAGAIGSRSAAQVLQESGVLDSVSYYDSTGELISSFKDENGDVLYTLPGYSEEESTQIYQQLMYLLCSPGHIGTMFQATSTNDITFWVLHPSVDRLWHLKRLGSEEFNETWDSFHDCVCHNPADLQPFHGMFPDWDDEHAEEEEDSAASPSAKRYYTNMELYGLLRPDQSDLPYVYDNFAWPHCSVLGEDMVA